MQASPTLCLVVLAASHTAHKTFDLDVLRADVDELVYITNPGACFGGFSTIANRVLDRTACDVFGIVHADTSFAPGALQIFKQAGATKVAGLVGLNAGDRAHTWSRDLQVEQEVGLLDNCSCFFPTNSGLRFDEVTFDSFHCNVEDLCWTASALDIPTVIPPALAGHVGNNTGGPEWMAAFNHYRGLLHAKHQNATLRPLAKALCG